MSNNIRNESEISFAEKVRGLGANSEYVEEIKKKCTLAEVKEIIKKYIPLMKKFDDGINPDTVLFYASKVTIGDSIALGTYLQNATLKKKKSPLDIMTLISDKTTHIDIGVGKVGVVNGAQVVSKDCPGGSVSSISGAQTLANVMSVCVKLTTVGKENKVRTFATDNKFAPPVTLVNAMSRISELRGVTPSELDKQAHKISTLDDEEYDILTKVFNSNVPKTAHEGENVPIATILTVEEDGVKYRDVSSYPFKPTRYTVVGEYKSVAKQFATYVTGSKFPAVKRIGKNGWTGTPVDNLPCDHVVAFHDAGIPVDSRVLVVSADTNLLSMLRSNFGAKVYGVGGLGGPFILPSEVSAWKFDYVYYPKPITMSPTGSFADSCRAVKEKMLKIFATYSVGQVVCHISPLVFYCKEFCDAFGVRVENSTATVGFKIGADPTILAPVKFLPSTTENYPIIVDEADKGLIDSVDNATHYKAHPTVYHKIKTIKDFTALSWGALDKSTFGGAVTQLSQYGTICFGSKTQISVSQAIGHTLAVMRDTFKGVWHLGYSSPHTYRIRLFVPGAVVESLEYDDVYSAMYKTTEREKFDKANEVAIAKVAGPVVQQGPVPVVLARPRASDLDDFGGDDDE